MSRNKVIERFLNAHPEYFEGMEDSLFLREDLQPLFEEYARAIDPEEYEELWRLVEAYRKKEKARLQGEVEHLLNEREQEERRLRQILTELARLEDDLDGLDRELASLMKNDGAGRNDQAWYRSGYAFLILDFLGIFFLYIGIILKERLTLSYVLVGVALIFAGFFLQQGGGSAHVTLDPGTESLKSELALRKNELEQISKIRRVTLRNNRKSVLGRISEVNRRIQSNLDKINECRHG